MVRALPVINPDRQNKKTIAGKNIFDGTFLYMEQQMGTLNAAVMPYSVDTKVTLDILSCMLKAMGS